MGRAQELTSEGGELARIAEAYHWPASAEPCVRSNFVATVDGRIQGEDGRSGSINTDADHLVFDSLRALCDVVVVGAGTVRAEGYRAVELTAEQRRIRRAAGLDGVPALVVVTRSLDLPPALIASATTATVVAITGSGHPGRSDLGAVEVHEVGTPGSSVPQTTVSPATILALCRDRGWSRVLLEGGPSLHHDFLSVGLVDEICLSIAPTVHGGSSLHLVTGPAMDPPREFNVAAVVLIDDTVMVRWRRIPADRAVG